MEKSPAYERPYHWWGPGPAPPAPLSLQNLVANGTIDLESAVTLWACLRQRRSVIIIGGPGGVGKSTLLHALVPALPDGTHRVYLRGCHETFAFLRDPCLTPDKSAVLINELSPHLPVYLWGGAVERLLSVGGDGYQLLATAHGRSVVEFVASLTGSPLRIPAPNIAAFNVVALLEPVPDHPGGRLKGLWQLSAVRDGVAIDRLGSDDLPPGVTPAQITAARCAVQTLLDQEARAPDAADDRDLSCHHEIRCEAAIVVDP